MGRVDEGVEEFFTKKIIPDYALKGRWEESNPAQVTPSESSSTSLAPLPLSPSTDSVPSCPESTTVSAPVPSTDTQSVSPTGDTPPTLSSPPSSLPLSTNTNTTNTSTAPKNIKKKFGDFFAFKRARTGRAAKAGGGEGGGESVKVKRTSIADLIRPLREAKDRERERDKERGAKSVEDVNVCNDAAITEGSAAVGMRLAGEGMDVLIPAKTLTITTPSNENAPTHPTTPAPSASAHTDHTDATVSQTDHPPEVRPEVTEGDSRTGQTSLERALRTKRSLREGKSQSLILLTGDEDKDRAHKKKNAQESSNSFEQRLQVMLHRISVGRSPPPDTKMSQNKDEELRKANSEGAILDKPESPSYVKPRTMSTSAAERKDQKKAPDPVRPLLLPKPPVPERPILPKPPVSAKPVLPAPCAPTGDTIKIRSLSEDGKAGESPAQIESQEVSKKTPPATLPKTELHSPALRKIPTAVERSEKAQSVTDESLPKARPHLKPPTQRRAVSVHEDTLAITQELKAVLQRSPIRCNKGELPTCTEDNTTEEDAQNIQEASEKLKSEKEQVGAGAKPKSKESEDSSCPSSATQGQKETLTRSPVSPPPQDKSPVQVPALSKTADKLQKSPQSHEKLSLLASSEISKGAHVSPPSDAKKTPSTSVGDRQNGSQVKAEDVSKQHSSNSAHCL